MNRSRSAFTLIEMAIVLIVIGLLTGGSAKLFSTLSKKAKVSQTEEKLQMMSETVQGFMLRHDRLPTASEFETLFLDREDSWGKEILYKVDPLLTQEGQLCHLKKTGLALRLDEKSEDDIAYLLLSSGANRNRQASSETSVVTLAQKDALEDYDALDRLQKEPFDDQFLSFSLSRLQRLNECKKERVEILNERLPRSYVSKEYHATIFADGGVSFENSRYLWCITDKSRELLDQLGMKTQPALHQCGENTDEWTKAIEVAIEGRGAAARKQGSYRLDIAVADSLGNQSPKSLILDVEY